jgi:ATP-dependent Lhr-like helicase
MYDLMNKLIKEHKTTLIFTNTRSATERVVDNLKEKFPTEYGEDIAAHHSSLSKTHRFNIEERLRDGKLKVVVCSTSLELGIDIGYIDLVIMLGSPKSSARSSQRIGRSGHKLHNTIKGRFLVMDRDDLVECCVIQKEMLEKKINRTSFPKNCLDVLSQQIFGMAIYKIWKINEILDLVRKSYCYQNLTKEDFLAVISYLSGEYDLEKSHVYGKIWYDKEKKEIGKRGKLARVIYLTNIGTIPEESYIEVKLAPSGEHIGYIDEGFLERMKKGDVFVLGGERYMYLYTRGMNLYVRGSVNRPPTIPSWFSEMLPLSFDSALEINRLRQLMKEKFELKEKKEEIIKFIMDFLYVDENTGKLIYSYFEEQHRFFEIPNTKLITIEKYKAEKNYILVNSMYGRRVNDALSRALGFIMGSYGNRDVEMGISDNGFYFAGESLDIERALRVLKDSKDNELKKILSEAIEKTDILTRRFRHCASRSLMILRNYKGKSRSVGKQQVKSHFLLHSVKKISKDFPILREARREVLEDLMDIQNTELVLSWIKSGKVSVKIKDVKLPSPFSMNLILQGHSDLIRIEDKQDFLKRMHELHKKSLWMKDEDVEMFEVK